MCPHWELNPVTFQSQDIAQPTEPHWQDLLWLLLKEAGAKRATYCKEPKWEEKIEKEPWVWTDRHSDLGAVLIIELWV